MALAKPPTLPPHFSIFQRPERFGECAPDLSMENAGACSPSLIILCYGSSTATHGSARDEESGKWGLADECVYVCAVHKNVQRLS